MKKLIISLFCANTILIGLSIQPIKVSIGYSTMDHFLSSLSDFDWTNPNLGDGLNFDSSAESHANPLLNDKQSSDNIIPEKEGSYLNFQKFNTSFKYSDSIKKQAVTGVPIDKTFMPNGNYVKEFGITSKSQQYNEINSLLDWQYDTDKDAKYNSSTIKLKKREQVATESSKWQSPNVNYEEIKNSTNVDVGSSNSNIGQKNVYDRTNTAYSYLSQYISWGGSWYEGVVVPPDGAQIDACHKNGVKIYGTIFLDGYHGLSKQLMNDFTRKDSYGNYFVVDVLISMAKNFGFDGWYINNEANGMLPNGSILDYNVLEEMVDQFNTKCSKSKDSSIRDLKIQFYKADATLAFNLSQGSYVDDETYDYTKHASEVCLNFNRPYKNDTDYFHNHTPNTSQFFMEQNPTYGGSNIYNMIDYQWYTMNYGIYDMRELVYNHAFSKDGSISYNKNSGYNNSIATYDAQGSSQFNALPNSVGSTKNPQSKTRQYLFQEQEQNMLSLIKTSGLNTSSSDIDQGLNVTNNEYKSAYSGGYNNGSVNFSGQTFLYNDPRFIIDKTPSNKYTSFYNNNKTPVESNSYGISDVVLEKTPAYDDGKANSCDIKTDFSLGNGIKFISNNNSVYGTSEIYGDSTNDKDDNYYAWSNKRLTDIQPTYQWQIRKIKNVEKVIGDYEVVKVDSNVLPIGDVSGFYDYDDPYRKGNSIAIGSGINEYGTVQDANFDPNSQYVWNIMGSNLQNKSHTVYFIVKESTSNENGTSAGRSVINQNKYLDNLKIAVTVTNQNVDKSSNSSVGDTTYLLSPLEKEDMKNGWEKIGVNLNNLPVSVDSQMRISKLGVGFSSSNNANKFKFNVGEFGLDQNQSDSVKYDESLETPSNANSEYVIDRKNKYSIRFGWDGVKDNNLDYYEIYWYDSNDKCYRVGETTQDIYYLYNLKANNSNLKLGVVPVFKDGTNGREYVFSVRV